MGDLGTVTLILMGCFVLLFLGGLLVLLVQKYNHFRQELDYVNSEIRRTDGKQKKYWLKKRRRLWLDWIPFYSMLRKKRK